MDMDAFTDKQLTALLQGGGNDACNAFLQGHDIAAKSNISGDGAFVREKYDNPVAELHRQKIKARVEGREEPTALPATESNNARNNPKEIAAATGAGRPRMQRQEIDFTNIVSGPDFMTACLTGMHYSNLVHASLLRSEIASYGRTSILGCVGAILVTAAFAGRTAIGYTTKAICTVVAGHLLFISPLYSAYHIQNCRVSSMKTSVRDFEKRCKTGRAKKGGSKGPKGCHYEVMFPPNTSIGDSVDVALVFYPGILVDHLAYAKILGELTDKTPNNKKMLVVLVNAEPHRVPSAVGNVRHLKSIQHEISTLMGISVGEWVLGGHGLGSMCASSLFLQPDLPPGIKRMVEWGSIQLQDLEGSKRLQSLLKIDASNDRVVLDAKRTFGEINKYPPACHVTKKFIAGGNHSGYAHYEGQRFPSKDWDRVGITLDEQHRMVVDFTTDYLAVSTSNKQED
jgi:hypothetical protein